MPLVPDFTAEQLSNLTSVLVTDTSTGSDVTIVTCRVFFQKWNGSYLVPPDVLTDYIPFAYSAGVTEQIDDLLDKSYALSVTVQWLNSVPEVVYTKTLLYGYSAHIKYGLYQLTQYQISNNNLLKMRNYQSAKLATWDAVLSGDNAVTEGTDITNAQRCYDTGTYLISHPELFY